MLHTLFRSPSQCDFALLLRIVKPGDELLLLQDGVLAALEGSRAWALLQQVSVPVSVLHDDVVARGLITQISGGVSSVSYTDFVTMTARHSQQMSW